MSTEQRGRGQEQRCQGLSPTLSMRTSLPSRSFERTVKGKESSKEWQWISPENRKPRVTQTPGSKKKKVRSRSGHHEPGRKGHAVTPGKRKRSAREKSVESGEVLSSGRSRTVSLGEEGAAG